MSRNNTRSSTPVPEDDFNYVEVHSIFESIVQEGGKSGSVSEGSTPMVVDSDEASVDRKQNKSSNASIEDVENSSSSSILDRNLNSEARSELIRKIDLLKVAVFKATMKGITGQEGSIEAKTFSAATRKLEIAQKSFALLFPQENKLVPAETPCFQWKEHVFNRRKPIFLNIEDCL
ncbi:hypothetical protein INT46_005142 [Mucor plumbeus]|uniref:Uncharacterized protein n=1 Tax=Mucor plumbeus TaxID=97098 RepID=A0A8H7QCT2_9FUNG|nr:hypothetical protein INT46_005142 [Mucor plumbeus]